MESGVCYIGGFFMVIIFHKCCYIRGFHGHILKKVKVNVKVNVDWLLGQDYEINLREHLGKLIG